MNRTFCDHCGVEIDPPKGHPDFFVWLPQHTAKSERWCRECSDEWHEIHGDEVTYLSNRYWEGWLEE